MKTRDAEKHFGSRYAIAMALRAAGIEIAPQSVYRWGATVPDLRQLQLETLTGGRLPAEPRLKPALTS